MGVKWNFLEQTTKKFAQIFDNFLPKFFLSTIFIICFKKILAPRFLIIIFAADSSTVGHEDIK